MTFFKSTILYGFLLTLLACGSDPADATKSSDPAEETDEDDDDTADDDSDPPPSGSAKDSGASAAKDAGGSAASEPKDAGASQTAPRDSGSSATAPKDSGAAPSNDAGKQPDAVDAGKDAGGGFVFPDLFPAAPDAGPSTSTPAPGARDPNGPCKDLMLFCFDPIDMFLFNADCFTCNGGKGCQGCAIPYAF